MSYDTSKPYTGTVMNLIKQTWNLPEACKVRKGGVVYYDYVFPSVDHTDGIGTKGMHHWQHRSFKAAVMDALAMNINDLYMCGAFPVYKLQNHVILPEDDHRAVENIVGALVAECKRRRIAVTGGETSVHSNIVGMDISVTMSGMWRGKDNQYQAGDAVVGIPSAGIHANGLTRARQLLGPDRPEWIVPTAIYDSVPEVYFACSACNHITGGGFTKLRHNLPHNSNAVLFDPDSEDMPPVFHELHAAGCTSDEMYRTFNCGWGFLLGCPRQELEGVLRATGGKVIGEITPGNGSIIISSAFDGESVIYSPRS